jgi:crotonobetainyl-CoA:carnitine CoA-transferase CaiB-like acyl-CoA transferase
MKRVHAFVARTAEEIARKTAGFGARVDLDLSILDRSDSIALQQASLRSANGSCELIRAQDCWIAANLPREDDLASVPALIYGNADGDAWAALRAYAETTPCEEIAARAEEIGLAISKLGETETPYQPCAAEHFGARNARRETLRVVDFSSLWAGPLCGSILAAMGADVIKIESTERPDPTAQSAPSLDRRLNGAKQRKQVALSRENGRAVLQDEIARSDILITSARARALDPLGISKERLFAANPALIWIAVTGHGYDSARIAFGDDAAVSGGLVAWEGDEPRFIGDALADPLTGLAAANTALDALKHERGAFIDAALARSAAYVAGARP